MQRRVGPLTKDDEELPWVLLAVDRFGSVGDRTAAGERLERAGLIKSEGSGHVVTPKGEKWVRRINQARR